MRIVFAVAMYNEEPVAEYVADAAASVLRKEEDVTFLFVDDGSTDKTAEVIRRYARDRLAIVSHDQRLGVGSCLHTGLEFAKRTSATHFGFLPGNGRIAPAEITKLLSASDLSQPEYLVGSRFAVDGHEKGTSFYRRILIRMFSRVVSGLLGVRLTDLTCGLRLIALCKWDHRMNRYFLRSGYAGEQILTIIAVQRGYLIREIGITVECPKQRPYSHMSVLDLPSIVVPWLRYAVWKLTDCTLLKPRWMS
jgi:dolichyl-phosphate beta-glucosyltransferase